MSSNHRTMVQRLQSPIVFPFVVYTLVSFATLLLEVPTIRLFETAICNQHYRLKGSRTVFVSDDVDERACKISEVQDLLANVVGWKMSFDAIPGLLTAMLYGSLAIKCGPRLVIVLSLGGSLLMLTWIVTICSFDTTFPVQVAWISSIFLFIGGGTRVFNSMIYTLVSDSLSHSHRTKYLYLLAAGPHFCRLIAPQIAAPLMRRSVLAPFWVSFSLLGACLPLIYFILKPQKVADHSQCIPDADAELRTSSDEDNPFDVTPLIASSYASQSRGRVVEIAEPIDWNQIKDMIPRIGSLFQSSTSRFCLAAFFLKKVAFTSEGFMFQYASEKFLWELRQTTWLRVASASSAVFVTLIACPLLTSILTKKGFGAHKLDLNVVRCSLAIVALSFFCAWRATSGLTLAFAMIGCGFGEGVDPALQGLVTFLADSAQNAQLFTAVAVFDLLGELTGGPLTARLMAIGRGPGHPSDGACFVTSSMIFAGLFVWSWLVKAKRSKVVDCSTENT